MLLVGIGGVSGCVPSPEPEMVNGGLYSVEDGQGDYRPAKLIGFDSTTAHLVLYCNQYSIRPDTLLASSLRLVPLRDELSGREHFPVLRRLFRAWVPERVGFDSITDSEQKLIDDWIQAGGRAVGE